MKKLLTILLLLTCITMVHAQTDYHILVKGVRVTSANASDVLRDGGSVKYIHAGNRIEFTNANISYGGRALSVESSYEKDLVVKFNGNNVLKNTSTSAAVISFYAPHKLTMYSMNDGSVDINGGSYGVYLGSSNSSQLSIQDLTCDITSGGYGIYAKNYVDIYNAKMNIKTTDASSYGIYHGPTSANNLYIRYNSNVTINAPGEKSYGIYCNSYSTPRIISNATLSINTSTTATGAFYCEKEAVLSETHFDTGNSITSNISYNSTLKGYSVSSSALVKTLKILPGTYYNLKVNGKEVTSINASSILGNSTVQYSYSTNTLTLNKANFSATTNAIYLGKSVKINVVGTNTITSSSNGIYSTYPFEITGTGILNIKSTSTSNYAPVRINYATMTVSGGVTVNLDGKSYGLSGGSLSVNKSVMNIHGDTEAFNSVQGLTFNDSQITDLFYNNRSGMYGNFTLEDGTYKIKYDPFQKKFTNNGTAISETIQDVAIGYRRFGLRIAGKQVDVNNCNDILGDGKVSYQENSNTLYMRDASINTSTYAILNETGKEFKVRFSGTNYLINTNGSALQSYYNHAPIHIYGDNTSDTYVLFRGDKDNAIYASDPISMTNIRCVVNATAASSTGIYAQGGLDATGAKIDIYANGENSVGFLGCGKISDDSEVKIYANASGSKGIYVTFGNLEVSRSKMEVSSGDAAIYCSNGRNLVLDPSLRINEVSTNGSYYYKPSNIGMNANAISDGINVCLGLKIGPYVFDGIKVANIGVTSLNMNDIMGDGTASFDPTTYTLYFNGTQIYCPIAGTNAIDIVNPGRDVTIVTDNECSFDAARFGLYVQGANVTIKGHSLDSEHRAYFSGSSAGASITNSSTLTLDNSYSVFYGNYWGMIGLPTCTLNLVHSKCHCYGVSHEEDAGSLRDFKQINYADHIINPGNPARIVGGTAYEAQDNGPVLKGCWIMIEPKVSGDVDGNGKLDKHDVERMQDIILYSMPYNANADVNGDGKITILDIVLLNELLLQNDK